MCAKRQRRCPALLAIREEAFEEWTRAETFDQVRSCWARLGGRTNVGNPVPTVRATVEAEGTNLSKRDIRLYLDGAEQRRFYYGRATGKLSYHPGLLSSGTHTVEIVAKTGKGSSTPRKAGPSPSLERGQEKRPSWKLEAPLSALEGVFGPCYAG